MSTQYTYRNNLRLKNSTRKLNYKGGSRKQAGAYEVAGRGSFGIVIAPAIPNKNNNGTIHYYPNNVTKIFHSKSNLNTTFEKVNDIKKKMPSLNIPTRKYKYKYTFKNLPTQLKPAVKRFYRNEKKSLKDDTEMLMIRTPFLGYSVYDIDYTNKYKQLRKLPLETICNQLHKCMKVVKTIHDAGYIHGDIRETNVLCNLKTGDLTIIDFDWLLPFNKFYEEYVTFFYPHPPECLFIWGRNILFDYSFPNNKVNILDSDKENTDIYKYVKEPYDIYDSNIVGKAITHFKKSHKASSNDKTNYGITPYSNELFDVTKHFIDSYGLGYTFKILLEKAWYYDIDDNGKLITPYMSELRKSFNNYNIDTFLKVRKFIFSYLIPYMTHSDYKKRWTINKAINEFEAILNSMDISFEPEQSDNIDEEIEKMKSLIIVETPAVSNSLKEVPLSPPSPKHSAKEIVNALETIQEEAENAQNGGKQNRRNRHNKTKKIKDI